MTYDFSVTDRRKFAAATGTDEQYLYQCLTGRREMGAVKARRVEEQLGGKLRRWHLCQKTWHLIWPELVGRKGAPTPPVEVAKACAIRSIA